MPEWIPDGGVQQGLPFLVILGVIGFAGVGLPTRGTLVERNVPASPVPGRPVLATAALAAGLALVGLLTLDSSWRLGLITSLTGTLVALSIVVLSAYVGQISLAPLALAGLAGFTMARLANAGWPTPLALVAGVALCVVVGVATALPAIRVRGMTLAVATLAAAVAIEELVPKSEAFTGSFGSARVPPLRIAGLDLYIAARGDAFPRVSFGIFVLVVTALAGLAVANLRRIRTGLRWLAVRSNERAAAAAGIDVTRTKLGAFAFAFAFAFASLLAGLGGTRRRSARPAAPTALGRVVRGAGLAVSRGAGIPRRHRHLTGALVAGVLTSGGLVTVLSNPDGQSGSQYQFAVSGLALILTTAVAPDGLGGTLHRLAQRWPIRSARQPGPTATECHPPKPTRSTEGAHL